MVRRLVKIVTTVTIFLEPDWNSVSQKHIPASASVFPSLESSSMVPLELSVPCTFGKHHYRVSNVYLVHRAGCDSGTREYAESEKSKT